DPATYQAVADDAPWKWSDREASLGYCVARNLRDYDVEVSAPKGQPLTVRVKDGGRELLAFGGHWETVFTRLGDTLFVAEFSPIATGCAVVAYDLKTGQQQWRCRGRGGGPGGPPPPRHPVTRANARPAANCPRRRTPGGVHQG